MHINIYDILPKEAQDIREAVFIKEQGFHDEFDDIDRYAKHLVLFHKELPVATCRFFQKGFFQKGFFQKESCTDYLIGRIAVLKQYRGKNIGAYLLNETEREIKNSGGKKIFLHAQCKAEKFYQKQGYTSYGEIDFEENCPHIWMCKNIEESI